MILDQSKGRWGGPLVSLQRAACCLLAFVLAGHGSSVRATEYSWVPVDADGAFTVAGSDEAGEPTEIILDEGPAYIVEFELRANGWSKAAGSPTLGTAQASVDATGFLGVNAVPSNPGVDLTPLNNQAWAENTGGAGLNDGAYIATDTCHAFVPPSSFVNSGEACGVLPATMNGQFAACPVTALTCLGNDDYIFNGNLAVGAVATHTPNYVWGGVTNNGQCTNDERDSRCVADQDPFVCCTGAGTGTCRNSYYMGTLILNIPAGATGRYSFGFDPDIAQTLMNNCAGDRIEGEVNTPGKITLVGATGKCCSNTRIDPQCIDSVTEFDCNAEPAPRFFTLGATCSGAADECAIDCNGVAVSVGGQLAGDFTGDGIVNLSDFQILSSFCHLSGPDTPMASPGTCGAFDFDCDGDVDVYDFAGFQHVFAP